MIEAAAVRVGKNVYTGRRHGAAIHAAISAGEEAPITSKMQGFVLDTGEFVSRHEARNIAIRCGQIFHRKDRNGKPLISEELW